MSGASQTQTTSWAIILCSGDSGLTDFAAGHEKDGEAPRFPIFSRFHHLGGGEVLDIGKSRFCEDLAQGRPGESEVEHAGVVLVKLPVIQIQISDAEMAGGGGDFAKMAWATSRASLTLPGFSSQEAAALSKSRFSVFIHRSQSPSRRSIPVPWSGNPRACTLTGQESGRECL